MSDTSSSDTQLGLPEAARHLGVSLRVLRQAIRHGKIAAPPHLTATAAITPEWLTGAQAAVEAAPKALHKTSYQKVPAFARYKGTSAWRKYRSRVREYAAYQALHNKA